MIKKREGNLNLRLDKVGWPSPLLPINTVGGLEIEGGQDFEERQREEGETEVEERRF